MIVAGGQQQYVGECLAQSSRALFEQRELVLTSLVEAVDVGVVEQAQLLGPFVGRTQTIDGCRNGRVHVRVFDTRVEDVAQVECDQTAAVMQMPDNLEISIELEREPIVRQCRLQGQEAQEDGAS